MQVGDVFLPDSGEVTNHFFDDEGHRAGTIELLDLSIGKNANADLADNLRLRNSLLGPLVEADVLIHTHGSAPFDDCFWAMLACLALQPGWEKHRCEPVVRQVGDGRNV